MRLWNVLISVALVDCAKPLSQKSESPHAVAQGDIKTPQISAGHPVSPNQPIPLTGGEHAPQGNLPPLEPHPQPMPPHPLIIPMIRLPGITQPAGGAGVGFQILEIRPGLRIVTPQAFYGPHAHVQRTTADHGWHSVYDASLMIVCVLLIAAILHMYRNRLVEPFHHASTTKLSSSFELRPTAKYGSIDRKNEEAVL
jgi:hypothetical protein